MSPHVVEVRYAGGYRVWLRFLDGLTGELDLSNELYGEVFEPLKDIAVFSSVTVDADTETIVWPNGADLSPNWLHDQLQGRAHAAAG